MVVEHSKSCLDEQARHRTEVEAWLARWPGYCEECQGRGGRTIHYDPSPAGVALSPGWMSEFEPCDECVGAGRCGRCGAPMTEADKACAACGWSCGDGLPVGLDGPCECWERAMAVQDEGWDAELATLDLTRERE